MTFDPNKFCMDFLLNDELQEGYGHVESVVLKAYQQGLKDAHQWMPIETAPKSLVTDGGMRGIYLLGYVPGDSLDAQGCMSSIWYEPLTRGTIGKRRGLMGTWFGEGSFEVEPTHWMPLPQPPKDTK